MSFQSITNELLKRLLSELDDALVGQPPVSLLMVGGAAVMQVVPHRMSADVDVAHPALSHEILVAATEIAKRHNVRTDWLNDMFRRAYHEAANALVNRPLTVIYEGTNLTVTMPPLQDLMRFKLMAGRPQDLNDLADLMAIEAPERTAEEWVSHFEASFRGGLIERERTRVREAAVQAQRIATHSITSSAETATSVPETSLDEATRKALDGAPPAPSSQGLPPDTRLCCHPTRTGECQHRVTAGKRCAAGHPPRHQRPVPGH